MSECGGLTIVKALRQLTSETRLDGFDVMQFTINLRNMYKTCIKEMMNHNKYHGEK
jgi:hypothetical protein